MLREYLTENYTCLHRRLLRLFGCPDLASDCLHDAWLRLGKTADDGSVRSLEAYVYRTALNVAMNRLRGQRRSRSFEELECEFEHLIDEAPSPDRAVEARCIVQALERALLRLPCRHRSVLLALRLEERTRQEVADSHRISLRRVDTVLRQALDYCAEESGQIVRVGVTTPRRRLPRRWRDNIAGAASATARNTATRFRDADGLKQHLRNASGHSGPPRAGGE